MALAGQNQVRHLYVGLKYPGHANVGALKGGANGDLALLSADGTAVAANKNFTFLKKNNKGSLVTSDIVNPRNILYAKSKEYTAAVLGSATVSGLTVNVNTLYTIEMVVKQFGSLSPENEYVKKAFYKAITGDDQENIVDGLVQSLARNWSREEPTTGETEAYTLKDLSVIQIPTNKYFSFAKTGAAATAALVITEKSDWLNEGYVVGKMTRTNLDFYVDAKFETLPTITRVASAPGIGDGYNVVDMEYYLKGERNDFYRGLGYPHNLENAYDATVAENYHIIELGYFDEGRDEAKKSKKQITIVMPVAEKIAMNVMIGNLNTILGAATIDLIP